MDNFDTGCQPDHPVSLEEARRHLELEEARRREAMQTIRWWAAGCLAVATLHGTLPFGLLGELDSWVVRWAVLCVAASLCGWIWAAWTAVRRLKPRPHPYRPGGLQWAYLQGAELDAEYVLSELWGNLSDPEFSEGAVGMTAREGNTVGKYAEDVCQRVKGACVITGFAAIAISALIVLGL